MAERKIQLINIILKHTFGIKSKIHNIYNILLACILNCCFIAYALIFIDICLLCISDTMTTIGDRVLNISLPKIGEKSLFTRDLEDALRNGGVDFVVHSLKDLPTVLPNGMAIGAVLEREDARDALVLRAEFKGHSIDTLPKGSVIGRMNF